MFVKSANIERMERGKREHGKSLAPLERSLW